MNKHSQQHDKQGPDAHDAFDAHDAAEARLTAYALGEMDGAEHAADRAAMEALLASDPAARASLAEIRELAGVLTADLAAEAAQAAPVAGLTGEQRHAIEAAMSRGVSAGAAPVASATPTGSASGNLRWLRFVPALAAAALIAAMVWHQQVAPAGAPDSSPESAPQGGVAGATDGVAEKDIVWFAANGSLAYPLPADKSEGDLLALGELESLGYSGGGSAPAVRGGQDGASVMAVTGTSSAVAKQGAIPSGGAAPGASGVMIGRGRAAGPQTEAVISADEIAMLSSLGYLGSDGATAGARAAPAAGAASSPFLYQDFSGAPVHPVAAADTYGEEFLVAGNALRHDLDDRNRDQSYRYFRTAPGGEGYEAIVESGFQSPLVAPRSTFSVDVDTASYANVRRFLNAGQVPPADAVRLEELINYFRYDYPQPDGEHPFSVSADVTSCPWAPSHRLVRLGLQGRTVPQAERAPSNLVFLVDVSGSMDSPDKLPLVQASLRLLVGKLDARDRIALVTYAGAAGLVLDSTSCEQKQVVLDALDRLKAGGSTAGGAGIALAYQVATQHFIKGGTNRVILATDGDFNVGATSREALQSLIENAAKSGVFLTVLGYGTGNLQDGTAELLADKGNGNYAYIDSLGEAQKVLVQQMGGTLITIAKDVKLQVEFNPGRVAAYRLLGYENRALATRDFNDDRKDAGEIGSGHSVTALYEIIPVGAEDAPAADALRYQKEAGVPAAAAAPVLNDSPELLYVALRYKQPAADSSVLLGQPVIDGGERLGDADRAFVATSRGFEILGPRPAQSAADLSFVAAVAEFGMLLRSSGNAGTATWDSVRALAEAGRGADRDGYRAEFIRLVGIAQSLQSPSLR